MPPGSQTFALLSDADVRHTQGAPEGQSESVKHWSYEHPPGPTRPSFGKQRPSAPLVHCESDEQPSAMADAYGWVPGAGPRSVGQQDGIARW